FPPCSGPCNPPKKRPPSLGVPLPRAKGAPPMPPPPLPPLTRQRLDTFPRRRASPFTDSRRQRFVRDRVIANPVHRSKVARAIGSGGDDLPADLTDLAKDHAKKRQGLGPPRRLPPRPAADAGLRRLGGLRAQLAQHPAAAGAGGVGLLLAEAGGRDASPGCARRSWITPGGGPRKAPPCSTGAPRGSTNSSSPDPSANWHPA